MKTHPLPALIIGAVFFLMEAEAGWCQEISEPFIGHLFYGAMTLPTEEPDADEDDIDIFIFGADAQKAVGGDVITYGFETGAFFSVDSQVRRVKASSGSGGGQVAVSVDVESILVDYFAGGFLSFEPTRWLRFSLGAGPLIVWSLWETEAQSSSGEPTEPQSDSGLGVGVYARAGVDLFLYKRIGLTVGARINETTLTIDNPSQRIDVEGPQYYVGLVVGF